MNQKLATLHEEMITHEGVVTDYFAWQLLKKYFGARRFPFSKFSGVKDEINAYMKKKRYL